MQTGAQAVTPDRSGQRCAGWWKLLVVCGSCSLAVNSGCRDEPAAPQSAGTSAVPVAEEADPEWQPPVEAGFVGSAACAECHGDISQYFQAHPMARSLRAVDVEQEAKIVHGTGQVPCGSRAYEVQIRDGQLFHRETMWDAGGTAIYDQAAAMEYVVGSGRRAFAYLIRQDDLLFMSPLNYYTEAQKWGLAPGYRPDDPRRFDRRVTEECVSCHAGRVATAGRQLDRFRPPIFEEMGIGCERCHGPGAQHVALHQRAPSAGTADDPIVNPADLDPGRRESVCYQCHLSAEVRVPRYGRSDLDFRPGDRLEDIWTVLVGTSGTFENEKARAVSHVQQMQQSECFAQSNGALGCISCHDPHRVPEASERVAFFRARCLTCHDDDSCESPHSERLAQEDSCIACHMPRRGASNVAHVTLTDHRVPRSADSASDRAATSDVLRFFDAAHLRLPEWEQNRALGVGAWVYLRKQGQTPDAAVAQLLVGVLERAPRDPVVLTVLGAMALDHNKADLARMYYEQARHVSGSEEMALLGLLKIDYLAGRHELALGWADQLLAINPHQASAHAMRADLLKSLGRPQEAIAAAQQALECNPTLIEVRQWLASAYAEAGQDGLQQQQLDFIRRMHEAQAQ